ncbi:MAG: outer membrane beta-barrel protein [Bacteroidota bacterium]
MKIKFLFVACLFVTLQVEAQKRFKHLYSGYYGNGSSNEPVGLRLGIAASIALTDITRDLLTNPNIEDSYQATYQPAAGLILQYAVTPKFMLGSGINYKPFAYKYKTETQTETTLAITKRNYLELPVLLNFTFREGEYQTYPVIYGGASISYLLNAQRDFEARSLVNEMEMIEENNQDVAAEFNDLDYGLIAGASFYIPFQTYFQLMVDFKAYIGLANINNLTKNTVTDPYTVNTALTLSIALIWGR